MTLSIGIIGATGRAGSAITKEAISRGLKVTAFVRSADKAKDMFGDQVTAIQKDAFDIQKKDIADFDVVIDGFATRNAEKAYQHVDLAAKLIELVKNQSKPRLFFILGAGSLEIGNGQRLINRLEKMPNNESFISIPREQFKEYEMLINAKDVNWVAISPSANFVPGDFADYELGDNDLLRNAAGKSEVTMGTVARVIVDEIVEPKHRNERFTVVNK
ncbi:NAD(P)-dependent oxidoreductase [Lentilactobacillus kisonensis]|uniref:NAD(P)-binding domain-containing protein n=2 Tax=Lentilactobacillus kisonensis TaxID=481722 RepID=H1LHY8_9LACO|nr:NAD(P)H-binding protein [Lentilactobacillus kisonensis]EHO50023.1 hypothetical protein HMPREF9104_02229 [Lentilactobacillus kisonensis F0435]KRL20844.1 hypothetical protein FC98_GL001249 [Lentilactobacillus kisonensis DSM 19906 = JCM 15041]